MLNSTPLISSPDLHVHDVRCSHPPAAWSGAGGGSRSAVVFARRGVFRRRARHGEDVIEPGVAYLQPAGEGGEFAHPHGGDACTAIRVSDELLASLIAEPVLPGGVIATTAPALGCSPRGADRGSGAAGGRDRHDRAR